MGSGRWTLDAGRWTLDTGHYDSSSVVVPAASAVLSGEVDFRMNNPHMPGEGVVPRERLLFYTQRTAHFLLARIVNCVLVSGEVVWPREDGVAGLACRGVDSLALVRPRLRVSL